MTVQLDRDVRAIGRGPWGSVRSAKSFEVRETGRAAVYAAAVLVLATLALLVCAADSRAEVPQSGDYFHKGLGHETPLPTWAKGLDIRFMPLPGQGPAAELAEAADKAHGTGQQQHSKPFPTGARIQGEVPNRGQGTRFTYEGGPIQFEPHIHLIFWGSAWNEAANEARKAKLISLYKGLSGSTYGKILTQYFANKANPLVYPEPFTNKVLFDPTSNNFPSSDIYVDTKVTAPTGVDMVAVRNEAISARAAAGWPAGTDQQFVVIPAPGSKYGAEMGEFCGYHQNIPAGPLIFIKTNSCGDSTTAAHEFAEAQTDPGVGSGWVAPVYLQGKYEGFLEAADLCETFGTKTALVNGAPVEPLWDNYRGECLFAAEPTPQFRISAPTVTADREPGGLTIRTTIDPAGYPALVGIEQVYLGTTRMAATTQIEGEGPREVTLHISDKDNKIFPEETSKYRVVAQIPRHAPNAYGAAEWGGDIESKAVEIKPAWPTTLCKVEERSCAPANRYPAESSISASGSDPLRNRFALRLGGVEREIGCSSAGLTIKPGTAVGQPLGFQVTSWTLGGCKLGTDSCSAVLEAMPTNNSIYWEEGYTGRFRLNNGTGLARWHVSCPGAATPVDCTFSYPFATNRIFGSASALIQIQFTSTSAEGSACGDLNRAHFRTEQFFAAPLYVSPLGGRRPNVEALPATSYYPNGATLHGTVDPEGYAATYQFEYVDAAAYAASGFSTAQTAPVPAKSAGAGSVPVIVEQTITNLKPRAEYFYRLSAENEEGVWYSDKRPLRRVLTLVADRYPTMVLGGGTTTHTIQTNMTTNCSTSTFAREFATSSQEFAVSPIFANCTMTGLNASVSVKMNGCSILFHPESQLISGQVTGALDIGGAGCGGIKISGLGCEQTIAPQVRPASVTYTNEGSGSGKYVNMAVQAGGLNYVSTGWACGNASGASGSYSGSWKVFGESGAGEPIGVQIADEQAVGVFMDGKTGEAANPPRFSAEYFPVAIAGQQAATSKVVLGTDVGKLECGSAAFSTVLESAPNSINLIPTFGNCNLYSVFGTIGVTATTAGCTYEMAVAGPPYAGGLSLKCPEGQVLKFAGPGCTVVVPPQALGSAQYTNTGSGVARGVTASLNGANISHTASGFTCGSHSTANGTYAGQVLLTGSRPVTWR